MTERRVQNDLVFEDLQSGMLLQAGSEQRVTKSVGIQFLLQTVYRLFFDHRPLNRASAGDVN